MSDIVLVQPKVGDWDTIRSHPSLPLALLFVSSFVDREYDIKIIDQRTDKNWERTLRNELKNEPLCVATTSMTSKQIRYALDACKIVKEESPVPTVWGGIHASLMPEQTLKNPYIDIVVEGEGELSFYELVSRLKNSEHLNGLKGVWFKSDGTIKNNETRAFIDMNVIPELPYHLIDVNNYLPEFEGRGTINIQLSRGCVHRCAFCYNQCYNKRQWRCMSAENSLENIKKVVDDFKIKSISFLDDNFFVDFKRARAIIDGIIKEGHDIIFEIFGIRIDQACRMSDDFFRALEKAGCRKLHFGVETGSQRILQMVKKDITIEQVIDVNRRLKSYDIITQYNFMAGFPTETTSDIQATINLVFRLMKENPNAIISPLCNYVPYPGTELFEQALKDGFKVPSRLEEWSEFDYGNIPWMSDERRKMIESLFLSSIFLHGDRNMVGHPLLKLFAKLYKPIATYRVKNLFFDFMIESKLKNYFVKD